MSSTFWIGSICLPKDWDADVKCKWLPLCLAGGPSIFYKKLRDDVKEDWEQLRVAFVDEYNNAEARNLLLLKLSKIKQYPVETVQDFASRIQLVAASALQGVPADVAENMMMTYFLEGLRFDLRRHVLPQAARDFNDACRIAKTVEANSATYAPYGETFENRNWQGSRPLGRLTQQMSRFSLNDTRGAPNSRGARGYPYSGSNTASNYRGFQSNRNVRRNVQCYNCGKYGHLGRDCRARGARFDPRIPQTRIGAIAEADNFDEIRAEMEEFLARQVSNNDSTITGTVIVSEEVETDIDQDSDEGDIALANTFFTDIVANDTPENIVCYLDIEGEADRVLEVGMIIVNDVEPLANVHLFGTPEPSKDWGGAKYCHGILKKPTGALDQGALRKRVIEELEKWKVMEIIVNGASDITKFLQEYKWVSKITDMRLLPWAERHHTESHKQSYEAKRDHLKVPFLSCDINKYHGDYKGINSRKGGLHTRLPKKAHGAHCALYDAFELWLWDRVEHRGQSLNEKPDDSIWPSSSTEVGTTRPIAEEMVMYDIGTRGDDPQLATEQQIITGIETQQQTSVLQSDDYKKRTVEASSLVNIGPEDNAKIEMSDLKESLWPHEEIEETRDMVEIKYDNVVIKTEMCACYAEWICPYCVGSSANKNMQGYNNTEFMKCTCRPIEHCRCKPAFYDTSYGESDVDSLDALSELFEEKNTEKLSICLEDSTENCVEDTNIMGLADDLILHEAPETEGSEYSRVSDKFFGNLCYTISYHISPR